MNILLFTPQLPYPPHQGTTIRNFYLIRHLARHHTIDLFTFLPPGQALAADSPLHELCRRIITVPQPERSLAMRLRSTLTTRLPDMALRLESVAMREAVGQMATDYAIIQVEGIEMAQYGLLAQDRCRQAGAQPLLLFDDHNCEYLLQKRNALTDFQNPKRWVAAAYSVLQWYKLRDYEAAICRTADRVTAVSLPDKAALERLVPGLHCTVVENGITPAEYQSVDPVEQALIPPWKLVFTGKMDYRPNVDAMLWFADEVLPLIQAKAAAVQLQIVGMNPHPRLARLHDNPAIEITGAVAQIAPYLRSAAVYIVPLRVGGGTRFKVLEAMAQGLPMVSTSLGVEGIGVTDTVELLVADSPAAFAEAVLQLLRDRQEQAMLCRALGQCARTFVEENYSWESIIPKLEATYADTSGSDS